MSYLVAVIGYLMGSIPFGYIVCKYWKGINIMEHGSGNIGFTNVLRTVGWRPAMIVLAGDVGKGALAAWLGTVVGGEMTGIVSGLAALLGHSFSLFLKFKGGKMVATGLGVLLILVPETALAALAAWLLILGLSKYVSVASITAGAVVPMAVFYFGESLPMKIFGIIIGAFVIFKHRSNIKRLADGTEAKMTRKKEK